MNSEAAGTECVGFLQMVCCELGLECRAGLEQSSSDMGIVRMSKKPQREDTEQA